MEVWENPEKRAFAQPKISGTVQPMNLPALPAPTFDDGRGLYPERIAASVPRGLPTLVREAAAREGVSVAEFVRRAIAARISMFQYAETLKEQE